MNVSRRTAGKAILAAAGGSLLSVTDVAAVEVDSAAEEKVCTEVCVIGGGSGGIGAALAATRGGARVVLLERDAFLGGTSTSAWVHTWEPVSGTDGLPRDIYNVMKTDPTAVTEPDYSKGAPRRGGISLPFEPRALIYAARQLLDATSRCQALLNTTFFRARIEADRVKAIETWFSGKRLIVEADVFIDCTADGDVCADAGCDYHIGEDPRSRYREPTAPEHAGMHLNGLTLCYRVTNTGVEQKPHLPKGIREGICPKPVHIVAMPNGDHLLNPVDMINGNAIVQMEYSRLMHEAHRRVLEHFYWLQRLDPRQKTRWTRLTGPKGYRTWALAGIAPRIGVRESRRILGDYVLIEQDCLAGMKGQKHSDIIAISDHAVDIHGKKGRLYEVPNGPYGVPYRCLLPRGVRNLMIASRAASFSHVAASSCRLSRTMMTLGQAAGTAAAFCVKHKVTPRQVGIRQLQATLKSQGVANTAG